MENMNHHKTVQQQTILTQESLSMRNILRISRDLETGCFPTMTFRRITGYLNLVVVQEICGDRRLMR